MLPPERGHSFIQGCGVDVTAAAAAAAADKTTATEEVLERGQQIRGKGHARRHSTAQRPLSSSAQLLSEEAAEAVAVVVDEGEAVVHVHVVADVPLLLLPLAFFSFLFPR